MLSQRRSITNLFFPFFFGATPKGEMTAGGVETCEIAFSAKRRSISERTNAQSSSAIPLRFGKRIPEWGIEWKGSGRPWRTMSRCQEVTVGRLSQAFWCRRRDPATSPSGFLICASIDLGTSPADVSLIAEKKRTVAIHAT